MGDKGCAYCGVNYYWGVAILRRKSERNIPMKEVNLESQKLENLNCMVKRVK